MATEAARLYPKVIAFWNEVLENEKENYTTAERLQRPTSETPLA
jgi:hypothetical protein